jgi:hypothetical protein
LFSKAEFWACHLLEAGARGAGEDRRWPKVLNDALGTSDDARNAFWTDVMMMEDAIGDWPHLAFSLGDGHGVAVTYFGNPRYDVEYRYSAPSGETVLLAVDGPSFMLHGLRWEEVQVLARALPQCAAQAILLLAPAASVSTRLRKAAANDVAAALQALGFASPAVRPFAEFVVKGVTTGSNWGFEPDRGWVLPERNCWRSTVRRSAGLVGLSDAQFAALKEFTEQLGLNPRADSGGGRER